MNKCKLVSDFYNSIFFWKNSNAEKTANSGNQRCYTTFNLGSNRSHGRKLWPLNYTPKRYPNPHTDTGKYANNRTHQSTNTYPHQNSHASFFWFFIFLVFFIFVKPNPYTNTRTNSFPNRDTDCYSHTRTN
jgi:hypothetical protein